MIARRSSTPPCLMLPDRESVDPGVGSDRALSGGGGGDAGKEDSSTGAGEASLDASSSRSLDTDHYPRTADGAQPLFFGCRRRAIYCYYSIVVDCVTRSTWSQTLIRHYPGETCSLMDSAATIVPSRSKECDTFQVIQPNRHGFFGLRRSCHGDVILLMSQRLPL